MTEQQTMLSEMVDRLFTELMSRGMPDQGREDEMQVLWQSVEELEITNLFKPENAGGFGGDWQDAFVVFNLLGLHALPLPVGETILAKKLLMDAGIDCPTGILTIGICDDAQIKRHAQTDEWLFSGTVLAVPWGAEAAWIVVACPHEAGESIALLAMPSDSQKINSATSVNEAGEPRADLCIEGVAPVDLRALPDAPAQMFALGALLRSAQMSGALKSALQLSLEHVNERVQFGRPLSKFQAIQHQLAVLAEECAAVNCAAMAACLSVDKSAETGEAMFEIAATKLRANGSVAQSTSIAHQTHGAIGFTREHRLHYFTQRLWSWRSEFGNERYWANDLGRRVLEEGAENFWVNLTARSDLR